MGAGWRPTNTKAILAVALLGVPAAAVVLGVLARAEIRRTGEHGWALATTGMVVGIVVVACYLAAGVAYALLVGLALTGVLGHLALLAP